MSQGLTVPLEEFNCQGPAIWPGRNSSGTLQGTPLVKVLLSEIYHLTRHELTGEERHITWHSLFPWKELTVRDPPFVQTQTQKLIRGQGILYRIVVLHSKIIVSIPS